MIARMDKSSLSLMAALKDSGMIQKLDNYGGCNTHNYPNHCANGSNHPLPPISHLVNEEQ